MNAEHSFSTDDSDAVVTYSRVPARRRGKPAPPRREPTPRGGAFSADPHDAVDAAFAAADLRVDRFVDGFTEDRNRTDWARYGVFGAVLAVIAGAGVLAASIGVVTIGPGETPSGDVVSDVTVSATAAGSTDSPTAREVRQISLNAGVPATEARAEVAPPIPRPRPEDVAAQVDSVTVGATDHAAASPQAASVEGPAVTARTPEVLAPPPVAAAPATESDGTDGLISSIEETLARIDANGQAESAAATSPSALPELPAVAASEPPPVVMTQPIYPPMTAGDGVESDIMPPPFASGYPSAPVPPEPIPSEPVADGGYYPDVPVPPEPVPQAYPPGPPPGPYVYPQSSGVHHTAPGAYPPPMLDETEARRPGVLRRTFARASVAVGRVLGRN